MFETRQYHLGADMQLYRYICYIWTAHRGRVCYGRHDIARGVQVPLTSSDSEAGQPAPGRRRVKHSVEEGSGDDDSAPGSEDEDEEESLADDVQRQPTRQLPGRSSRPVSYKDNSSSGGGDEEGDDIDVAGVHDSPPLLCMPCNSEKR